MSGKYTSSEAVKGKNEKKKSRETMRRIKHGKKLKIIYSVFISISAVAKSSFKSEIINMRNRFG